MNEALLELAMAQNPVSLLPAYYFQDSHVSLQKTPRKDPSHIQAEKDDITPEVMIIPNVQKHELCSSATTSLNAQRQ